LAVVDRRIEPRADERVVEGLPGPREPSKGDLRDRPVESTPERVAAGAENDDDLAVGEIRGDHVVPEDPGMTVPPAGGSLPRERDRAGGVHAPPFFSRDDHRRPADGAVGGRTGSPGPRGAAQIPCRTRRTA